MKVNPLAAGWVLINTCGQPPTRGSVGLRRCGPAGPLRVVEWLWPGLDASTLRMLAWIAPRLYGINAGARQCQSVVTLLPQQLHDGIATFHVLPAPCQRGGSE